ncbi:hypothetical protein FIBSPDRAFT_942926 [Athelia psychrophila]|uniref:Uncharacterized protein n=1 Tax=Athelia psychrophila TaxID=1759441 RepID=A0A166WJ02_9AGAM|nr:hypothetical protein FIBSPDRAFT_942926 [Fibularhizoctonia sp. CBS 109695]
MGSPMDRLPDELVKEFLGPWLRVSDEEFAAIDQVKLLSSHRPKLPTTFAKSKVPTSHFLLVCKRWLRISTPLLYSAVIIRSKAQVTALARTLGENNLFGLQIRKIRVEGGYTAPLKHVIKLAPNLTHFFLSLDIMSSENVTGLIHAMPTMKHTHMYLQKEPGYNPKSNASLRKVEVTLFKSMATWKSLKTVIVIGEDEYRGLLDQDYFTAIANIPNLQYLDISILTESLYSGMHIVGAAPSLIAIRVDEMRQLFHDPLFKTLADNSPLHKLLQFEDNPTGIMKKYRPGSYLARLEPNFRRDEGSTSNGVTTSNPAVKRPSSPPLACNPLQNVIPDDQDIILANIVSFVNLRITLSKLCYVSKKFKALATPHMYRSAYFDNPAKVISYTQRVADQPILGSYLEGLYYSDAVIQDVDALVQLANVFVYMTNLQYFQNTRFETYVYGWPVEDTRPSPWAIFTSLAQHTGRTLEKMESVGFLVPKRVESPALWASFYRLKELMWCCETAFQHKTAVAHDALPMLEKLTLRSYDPSFIRVLNKMDLPSLTTIVNQDETDGSHALLKRHGSKLTALFITESTPLLVLDLCPNIMTLTIISRKGYVKSRKFPERKAKDHQHLTKIYFNCLMKTKVWDVIRKQWDLSSGYSALLEIQANDVFWPQNTDHAIRRNPWVKWSDQLLENHNIKVTSRDGDAWVPRLKLTK